MEKEYERNTVEFVRIGYHDACINFVVSFREYSRNDANRFAELKQAIKAAGQYNEFEPSKVITAIERTSGMIQEIRFGREGSPVMYLHLIPGSFEGQQYKKYPASELRSREKQIRGAFTYTAFDEWSREGNVIRIWWD